MSSAFKPLVPSAPSPKTGVSGRMAAAGDTAGKFSPLAPHGSSAKGHFTNTSPKATGARQDGTAPEPANACATPVVTNLIRDGERITHIEVRCGCGEVITIECGY
jgi:hypothetical protein